MFLDATDQMQAWARRSAKIAPWPMEGDPTTYEHLTTFYVPRLRDLDLIDTIRASLDLAMREGRTLEAWKAELVPELKRSGWWGVVRDADLTGTTEPVIVNERRLQTIFRTNIRMSQAAGRWAKIQREKERFPYLRYLSDHWRKDPRKDHRSWHGIILPVDHPWWQTHFPPNGWGCRCDADQVTESEMEAEGWTVSEPALGDRRHNYVPDAFRCNPGIFPPEPAGRVHGTLRKLHRLIVG